MYTYIHMYIYVMLKIAYVHTSPDMRALDRLYAAPICNTPIHAYMNTNSGTRTCSSPLYRAPICTHQYMHTCIRTQACILSNLVSAQLQFANTHTYTHTNLGMRTCSAPLCAAAAFLHTLLGELCGALKQSSSILRQ